MLGGVGSSLIIVNNTTNNNTQHVATHRNRVAKRAQHAALSNVAIVLKHLKTLSPVTPAGLALSYNFLSYSNVSNFISVNAG